MHNANVGDIVAEGLIANDNCQIDSLTVKQSAGVDGKTSWLVLSFDDECRVIVVGKWRGLLENGPSDLVIPLQKELDSKTLEELSFGGIINPGDNILSSGTKTSKQLVFMYGYGGPGDKLTTLLADISFYYDGSLASIIGYHYSCGGTNPGLGWRWIVDRCFQNSFRSSGSYVYQEARGLYHCDPTNVFPCNLSNPDGYYHTLINYIQGNASGTSSCTYSYTGQIVAGYGRSIYQGCS